MSQISVNASIISSSGGTCVCNGPGHCATDQTYLSCIQEVKQDLITSTAAISALSSVLMGALANLPVGMAPGMGINAYVYRLSISGRRAAADRIPIGYAIQFTYSIVGFHGGGFITYQEALSAVFLEGCVSDSPD